MTVETLAHLGGNQWGVVVRYLSMIDIPGDPFDKYEVNLRLEGVMTMVPLPGAAWLLISGLMGLYGPGRRAV